MGILGLVIGILIGGAISAAATYFLIRKELD